MKIALLPNLQQLGHELHIAKSSNPPFSYTLFVSVLFFFRHLKTKAANSDFPPSPRKPPAIGHLHLPGKLPHRSLQALSEKYGSLMLLYSGQTPILVVSSAETAMEVLKTHDDVFSNRPQTTAARIFLYGCTDIHFSTEGKCRRQVKKFCVRELLSLKKVWTSQFIREEVTALIDKLRCACDDGASVNLSQMLLAIANIISRCVLGQKTEEGGKSKFVEVSRRMLTQFVAFSFGDVFPALGWMDDLTGLNGQLKAIFIVADAFLDQVIEEHRTVDSDDHLFGRLDLLHTILQLQKKGMLDIELKTISRQC